MVVQLADVGMLVLVLVPMLVLLVLVPVQLCPCWQLASVLPHSRPTVPQKRPIDDLIGKSCSLERMTRETTRPHRFDSPE